MALLAAGVWQRTGGRGATAGMWASGDVTIGVVSEQPTPHPGADGPLGTPIDLPADRGPFQFVATQSGSSEPVAYDPCRSIPVVMNHRTAPEDSQRIVNEAIDEISRITGLQFDLEGGSDEIPVADREPFQPDRYGDRWAPVLIAWSDPSEVPDLAGWIAGLGGSAALTLGQRDVSVYVTGAVVLDGPQFEEILDGTDGRERARGIIIHELAHLVGLDHVDDPTQLMYPEGQPGVTSPASGDIAGLVQLGRGDCVPEL